MPGLYLMDADGKVREVRRTPWVSLLARWRGEQVFSSKLEAVSAAGSLHLRKATEAFEALTAAIGRANTACARLGDVYRGLKECVIELKEENPE